MTPDFPPRLRSLCRCCRIFFGKVRPRRGQSTTADDSLHLRDLTSDLGNLILKGGRLWMTEEGNFRFCTWRYFSVVLFVCILFSGEVFADAPADRFSAGGYFRIMARPDLEGGWSRLGLWNISGRLLNEGPWGALELKLDLQQPTPGTKDVWTSVHAKIEGGSVRGADVHNGALSEYGLTQLYLQAGNVLFEDVIWQVGTLDYYYGDLGLYDMRPAELFFETMGISATWTSPHVDVLLGVGDSGYFMRRDQYSTILTAGGGIRIRVVDGLELGLGGQFMFEPAVEGNRFGPHKTPLPEGVTYEDFLRSEVVKKFLELNPGQQDQFPKPIPVSTYSYKAVAYLGFGKLGPLVWNNLFANFLKRHPDTFVTETQAGRDYNIYLAELTDERYQLNVGNEMQLRIIDGIWDVTWGALLGWDFNRDNTVSASEDDRLFYSFVLRNQFYVTRTLHFLAETSWAQEISSQGNLWRAHHDSVFKSQDGLANTEGLEFGDLDRRNTWQLKTGFVINPTGRGIFTRPSIRILYGLQYSNMHNAFGNSFVETLDEFNEFAEKTDRHWHSVIAIEAEAWF